MEKEKLRIGIDIDETLADTMTWINMFYNSCFKTNFVLEDYQTYSIWKTWEITKEEFNKVIDDFQESSFFERVMPIEDSQGSIKILSKDYDLITVTCRPYSIHDKTCGFVRSYFPEIKKIISNGNDKRDKHSKLDACLENSLDYLVDDNSDIVMECVKKDIACFLMDKPWNQNCEHENITRVKNWNEILERLK